MGDALPSAEGRVRAEFFSLPERGSNRGSSLSRKRKKYYKNGNPAVVASVDWLARDIAHQGNV